MNEPSALAKKDIVFAKPLTVIGLPAVKPCAVAVVIVINDEPVFEVPVEASVTTLTTDASVPGTS